MSLPHSVARLLNSLLSDQEKQSKSFDPNIFKALLKDLEASSESVALPSDILIDALNAGALAHCPPRLYEQYRFPALFSMAVIVDQYIDMLMEGLEDEQPFGEGPDFSDTSSSDEEAFVTASYN
ncbi:hypothetical protein RCL1_008483 [Eukaryota sp. TZLM3-RCL]